MNGLTLLGGVIIVCALALAAIGPEEDRETAEWPTAPVAPPESDYELVQLPCGCQDVHYADGRVEREHDYVACDGVEVIGIEEDNG